MNPEKREQIRHILEERVPFNKLLELRVDSAEAGRGQISIEFRQDLVGNYLLGILHGGVIAAVLDVAGGLAAMASYPDREPMHGLGTVDLRVDYLRPGKGERFVATAETMRPGRLLVSTRMELHNDADELIAIGTAIYRTSAQRKQTPVNL